MHSKKERKRNKIFMSHKWRLTQAYANVKTFLYHLLETEGSYLDAQFVLFHIYTLLETEGYHTLILMFTLYFF